MGWKDDPIVSAPKGKNPWENDAVVVSAGKAKRTPGVNAALREITARYKDQPISTMSERLTESATLGGYGAGTRNLARGRVALQRMLPGGDKMPYTADEYHTAAQLYDAARREQYAAKHPGRAFAADIAGGAMMPGGKAISGFVTGAEAARLAAANVKVPLSMFMGQLGRMSVVGAGTSATQSALQARPKEATSEAIRGGATGAVFAPALGAGVVAGGKIIKSAKDIASRIVNPRNMQQLATEKLQKLLQNAQVPPALIKSALESFSEKGSISPSVYDVLRKAGVSNDVLGLFREKGSYPTTREAATTYADKTTNEVQGRALEATRKLPTSGETRTPSQIRAEQAAEAARVKSMNEQATAGVAPSPTGPERGSGARQLQTQLNTVYDNMTEAFQPSFDRAQAAGPNSATIPDEERAPVISAIIANLGHLNVKIPEIKKIALMIEDLRLGRSPDAPTTLPPLPENDVLRLKNIGDPVRRAEVEAQIRQEKGLDTPVAPAGSFDDVRPLTVQEMWDTREALGGFADNTKSKNVLRIVARGKEAIDDQLTRLLAEDKINGDPAVVTDWREGLDGFFQRQSVFGEGLQKTLTDRVPSNPTQTVVRPYQAGDVIFGAGESPRNLNDLRADLEPLAGIVPDAVTAVQRELYTRIGADKLPEKAERFNEVFGDLLPRDLTDAATAARQQAAQVEAQNAQRLASTEAQQARVEGGLGLGESIQSMPSGDFSQAVANLPGSVKPLAQTGGRQKLLNTLENPAPGDTALLQQLQGGRGKGNLGSLYGDEGDEYLRTLQGIEAQTQGAQELEQATGGTTPRDEVFVASPRGITDVQRGAAQNTLAKMQRGITLSAEESLNLFNFMKSQGAPDLATLEGMARVKTLGTQKYPDAANMQEYLDKTKDVPSNWLSGLIAPVTKTSTSTKKDPDAMWRLRKQYGLEE